MFIIKGIWGEQLRGKPGIPGRAFGASSVVTAVQHSLPYQGWFRSNACSEFVSLQSAMCGSINLDRLLRFFVT